ncbi:hypothetical protein ACFXTN_043116 [Malus domestica]
MEMEENERNLRCNLENVQTALDASRPGQSDESISDPKTTVETENDVQALKKAILEKLEERKKELVGFIFAFDLTVVSSSFIANVFVF